MKLVGASNWFVRAPFMLEGLLCGLAGSILAVVLLLLAKELALPGIMGRIESPDDIQAWSFPDRGAHPRRDEPARRRRGLRHHPAAFSANLRAVHAGGPAPLRTGGL